MENTFNQDVYLLNVEVMNMEAIIEVHALTNSYGDIRAVKGIDLLVKKGSLLAFVGPNGAGKSTTIHMLTTLLKPDSGDIIIAGFKVGPNDEKIKHEIGIVFQDSVLDDLLTVQENLMIRGSFYGLTRKELNIAVANAMTVTDIHDIAKRRFGKLSGGQKRRVDIARALIHQPNVLFLDEPTTGLDPQTRLKVWDTIEKLQKEKGMTVFLTTHYMEEAGKADYVYVIDDGKIVAMGSPNDLKNQYSSDTLQIKPLHKKDFTPLLDADQVPYKIQADTVIIPLNDVWDAEALIAKYRLHIVSFQVLNGTMDDAFVAITGKELRDL